MANFIPAGANAVETSDLRTSGDVTVTDTQPGTVADGEFLTNSGGNLTGGSVTSGPLSDYTLAATGTVSLDRSVSSSGVVKAGVGGFSSNTVKVEITDDNGISIYTTSKHTITALKRIDRETISYYVYER